MPRLLMTLFISLLFSHVVHGNNETVPVDYLLQQKEAPEGVVFEIVSDEDDLLEQLLPDIKHAITKLRKKFPELPIAIVTHGKEQFALTTNNSSSQTHSLVKALVVDEVEVHVCGTHASWYGIRPEDFPDYVDVSTTAPSQLNDYEEMGYELIVLTE
ncbi:MAG: hypothetical protein COA54_06930 [Thiotrichaceae bacterium]|nr:MAG: hypothetical protein COA54_06930 [Thiotrichaceae bacterium]